MSRLHHKIQSQGDINLLKNMGFLDYAVNSRVVMVCFTADNSKRKHFIRAVWGFLVICSNRIGVSYIVSNWTQSNVCACVTWILRLCLYFDPVRHPQWYLQHQRHIQSTVGQKSHPLLRWRADIRYSYHFWIRYNRYFLWHSKYYWYSYQTQVATFTCN